MLIFLGSFIKSLEYFSRFSFNFQQGGYGPHFALSFLGEFT